MQIKKHTKAPFIGPFGKNQLKEGATFYSRFQCGWKPLDIISFTQLSLLAATFKWGGQKYCPNARKTSIIARIKPRAGPDSKCTPTDTQKDRPE